MKFPVYAVRDSLVGFGMPVLRDNDAVASRRFEYDINVDGSVFQTRPQDYQLFHIGDYDTDDGSIVGVSPRMVVSATDLYIKEK